MKFIKRMYEWDDYTTALIGYDYYEWKDIRLSLCLFDFLIIVWYSRNCNINWFKWSCCNYKKEEMRIKKEIYDWKREKGIIAK